MSVWDLVRVFVFQYWFVAWIAFVLLALAASPLVHALRLWRARRRFIESQGARLLNPQNADARFQLANLYADGRAWRRALAYAQEAVRVARDNPLFEGRVPYHFLRLLGDALYHRGRLAEAVDAYRGALDAPSDLGHADALFGLGRALLRQGKREEAVDVLRRAIRENGSKLEAYFRWAQAAAALGRPAEVEEARREFRAVAAALPRFARQGRLRWRAAFWLFPLTRRIA
jgi:tetratricopeptide (TPR) repeat protein